MQASETVEITGHLMDSGILSRVLDDIREYGGDYVIDQFDVGHDAARPVARDDHRHRRGRRRPAAAADAAADPRRQPGRPGRGRRSPWPSMDGVFPDGFYSTTNLETRVRLGGSWVDGREPRDGLRPGRRRRRRRRGSTRCRCPTCRPA